MEDNIKAKGFVYVFWTDTVNADVEELGVAVHILFFAGD
jgi:hypothetical protein